MRTHKKKEKMQEECPSATSGIECTSIQIQNRVTTDQCNLVLLSQRKLCFKKKLIWFALVELLALFFKISNY
jgi:predicted nucleic acid-binding Zn ribbon protein